MLGVTLNCRKSKTSKRRRTNVDDAIGSVIELDKWMGHISRGEDKWRGNSMDRMTERLFVRRPRMRWSHDVQEHQDKSVPKLHRIVRLDVYEGRLRISKL